jgi:hypothetical protein
VIRHQVEMGVKFAYTRLHKQTPEEINLKKLVQK